MEWVLIFVNERPGFKWFASGENDLGKIVASEMAPRRTISVKVGIAALSQ